jgi:hypothetical protein
MRFFDSYSLAFSWRSGHLCRDFSRIRRPTAFSLNWINKMFVRDDRDSPTEGTQEEV